LTAEMRQNEFVVGVTEFFQIC